MKKEAILILLFLCLISLATAAPILELNKPTFQPGETLLGKITTDFEDKLTYTDIEFFKGNRKIPFQKDIIFYDNTYYFYTYLTQEGDFTMKISEFIYREDEELKSISLEQNISVKQQFIDDNNTQTAILSIRPGLIFTTSTPEITISNKGNTDLEIKYLDQTITLPPAEHKVITYLTNQSFSYLNLETYETFNIPVIYINFEKPEQIQPKLDTDLKINPTLIHINTIPNQPQQQEIELINFAETNITDLTISTNLDFITFETPEQIPAKSIQNLTLTINPQEQGFFSGNLTIKYSNQTIILPINLYSFPEETGLENIQQTDKSCSELAGVVCTSNQKCSTTPQLTFGGEYCCLTSCETIESESETSWTWLWGIIIILALGAGGYFVYKKIKKTKPQEPKETLKKSTELYEKRVKGSLTKT